MAEYLHRFGFKVDVINLAAKMLSKNNLDVRKFLASLKTDVFGLDLHWLPHLQGAIEVAKLLKSIHPDSKIILGGFTSTYYHHEILSNFPFIDAIIRGDSGEIPVKTFLELSDRTPDKMSDVPNLSWRNEKGELCINPITYVQDTLDELISDYKFIASFMIKTLFSVNRTPYFGWKRYPMGATLLCKGCVYNCVTCGGSRYTYKTHFGREKICFRSPESIVKDMSGINGYVKMPTWILGDIRQAGTRYVHDLVRRIREEKIDSPVIIELFEPVTKEFINELANIPRFGISFSPDSGNELVRKAQGRNFTNSAIEKTISLALAASTSRLDLFFMLGLGRDDTETVAETFKYAESLMEKFEEKEFYIYMSTLVPTLDPGSPAFDNPSEHGFQLHYRSLLDHYNGFSKPSWRYFLNYRTDAFNVDQIVALTYQVASFMVDLKSKYNILDKSEAEKVKNRITLSKALLSKIDGIMRLDNEKERYQMLQQLTDIIQKNRGDEIIHSKNELDRRHI